MSKLTTEQYKELSIKEFTKAAEKYESKNAGVYEICKEDYPQMVEMLKEHEFTDLLDAGCGPAPLLELLCKLFPNKHYTGLDLTPAMIEKAKEKNLPNTTFVVGDCENLPFPDESFDVIVCCESFHHYPNPQNFFNSVYRCLRKGGVLYIRDYAAGGFINFFMNKMMMPLINAVGHGDVQVCTEAQLREMCTKSGLTVDSFKQIKGINHKMDLIASKR